MVLSSQLAAFVLLWAASLSDAATTVALPNFVPPFATTLSKSLIGLSIEMDRWDSWAGPSVGSPNTYVNQVLSNLNNLTGQAVPIRVGANSEDRGVIQAGVDVINSTFPAPTNTIPYPEASLVGIGRDFYALSGNFPDGTAFTWGINLKSLNVTETAAQAFQLYDTFYGSRNNVTSNVSLKLVEIGNEVDFYNFPRIGNVLPGWELYNYISTWTNAATQTLQETGLGNTETKFQIAAYADFFQTYIWDVVGTVGGGILNSDAGSKIGAYSQHLYFGAHTGDPATEPKSGTLQLRTPIRSNLTRIAEGARFARASGLEYGETNSYANHGSPGVSDSAEAAIWLVDYALQAACVGVTSVYFHQGIGFSYNLIQPIPINGSTTSARVQGGYYGAYIVNEAIGSAQDTKIAELPSNSTDIAAYGIWEGSKLARAVLINSISYFPDINSTRAFETVSLRNLNLTDSVRVKRLSVPATNAVSGITWAGQNFDQSDGKIDGAPVEDILQGDTVHVDASEVVLLSFF